MKHPPRTKKKNDNALVNDLRGHTYCCGSESGSFHTLRISCNSCVYMLVVILCRNFVLVVSAWIVSSWRLPWFKSSFVETSMYVQTNLDGSLLEALLAVVFLLPMQLGAWPGGSWLPWWAAPLSFFFLIAFGMRLRVRLQMRSVVALP